MELNEVTAETLEMIKKAASEGILVGTGIQGVDLSGLVSLIPVNVPARNNTSAFPRTIAGEGSQTAVWRTLLNINSQQSDAAVGFDYAGSLTKFEEQNCFAPYKPLAKAGRVTLDAVAVARNYADALAVAELQTLNQLFIDQDLHIINSQNWPVAVPNVPTFKNGAAESANATVEAAEYEISVAARSGANYFIGGSTQGSVAKVTTGEAKKSIVATTAAVKGAVAYDWFIGKKGGTLYYYTTTTVAQATFTSIPTKAEALPLLPLLSATAPEANLTLLIARTPKDTSFSPKWYNGVIANTLGDYSETGPVAPGSGEKSSGASYVDYGRAKITATGSSIDVLDQINAELWASVQLSPTAYMCNSLQAAEISEKLLETNAALTLLPPTDQDARTNLAGGGYIGRYINKAAGGVPVMIEVHPHMAPGTIVARTDRVPFPGSNIGSVFEVRCQYDTMRFDYAANYNPEVEGGGPRYDFEVRSMETLVNRAPVAQAVVSNIG
jgi:hypothetical protein